MAFWTGSREPSGGKVTAPPAGLMPDAGRSTVSSRVRNGAILLALAVVGVFAFAFLMACTIEKLVLYETSHHYPDPGPTP